jgi:glycosyltransferase involved in cell wall biosynthesis
MRKELAELSPRAASTAILIPGGVDTAWFSPGDSGPDDWADAGDQLIVTARRLSPRTGVLELVEAMSAVTAQRPGVRLAILGDGLMRKQIQDLVTAANLSGAVKLLGRVHDEDLRAWYRRADLAVTPTQELEGFGLSTAEAMACGTMPLVTPIGANPELVQELPEICMSVGQSASELATAISRALAGSGAPGVDAVRHIAESWSWPAVSQRHLDVMEQLASHSPVGGNR